MSRQQRIAATVSGIHAEEISAHFNLLPERYFVQTDDAEVALHIGMVNRLLHSISAADSLGSLRPVIEWHDDFTRGCSVVHVVTWDRAGLFFKLAGAFSVVGLNILAARITTRNDHIAIDTFEVTEPGNGPVRDAHARSAFGQTVEEALVSNKDLGAEIAMQTRKHSSPPTVGHPPSVEVYLEIASPRVIVEVHAPDRFGLLYRIGHVLTDEGFSLTAARVHTQRGLAIDSFYLESGDHGPVTAARLAQLQSTLAESLAASPTA
ncbi:MAG TPA: ACT domain-containing protein [Candidatus Didemnitutus sp.]